MQLLKQSKRKRRLLIQYCLNIGFVQQGWVFSNCLPDDFLELLIPLERWIAHKVEGVNKILRIPVPLYSIVQLLSRECIQAVNTVKVCHNAHLYMRDSYNSELVCLSRHHPPNCRYHLGWNETVPITVTWSSMILKTVYGSLAVCSILALTESLIHSDLFTLFRYHQGDHRHHAMTSLSSNPLGIPLNLRQVSPPFGSAAHARCPSDTRDPALNRGLKGSCFVRANWRR